MHMEKRKAVASFCVILVIVLAGSFASLAWFYFPVSQNVNLSTDHTEEVNVHLYEMQLVDTDYLFQGLDAEGNPAALNLSHDWSFFQWGDEYLLESDAVHYFALECVCDTDTLKAGKAKLVMDFTLRGTSQDVSEEDEAPIYLPFEFITVDYAIVKTNMNDYTITAQRTATQVRSMADEDFTRVSFVEDDANSTDEVLVKEGTAEYTYQALLIGDVEIPYFTRTTGTAPNIKEEFRSVIIFKLTADPEIVTSVMNAYERSHNNGFGSLVEVTITNSITINCNIRTVPVKPLQTNEGGGQP